jgi:hypothetical protein
MNGYQPKMRCDSCLKFEECKKGKNGKEACKKYEGKQPSPPKTISNTPVFRKPVPMPPIKPAKQRTVLSVRDFAILYNMANDKIVKMESQARNIYSYMFDKELTDIERNIQIENNMEQLRQDPLYQDLLRIREKLGELNIEVETPIVEVEE